MIKYIYCAYHVSYDKKYIGQDITIRYNTIYARVPWDWDMKIFEKFHNSEEVEIFTPRRINNNRIKVVLL